MQNCLKGFCKFSDCQSGIRCILSFEWFWCELLFINVLLMKIDVNKKLKPFEKNILLQNKMGQTCM